MNASLRWVRLAAVAFVLSLGAPALAGDKALAETLFVEGRKLMEAGDLAGACERFDASNREDPSPGTMLNLALCYEKRGMTASAWALFRQTITAARTAGRTAHETSAREGAERLESKLSRLTITLPGERPPGLEVKRGDVVLTAGAFGVPVAVDPGEHTIEATAPGYEPYRGSVTVGPDGDSQSVAIPPLKPGANGVGDSGAGGSAGGDVTLDRAPAGNKTLGYVLAGVGVVALGTGVTFGALAQSQANAAENDAALCPNKQCTPAGRKEIDAAETKALLSTIGVGVGVAALGAGIYFLVADSGAEASARRRTTRPRIVPFVGTSGGGVGLTGAF